MALTHSTDVPLGMQAPDFNLAGTDDRNYSLDSFKEAKALVILFICNHCPYVIATLHRFIDLQRELGPRGVQVIGINPNDAVRYPDDSLENMKKIAAEEGINFPYLVDETQEIAKAYGAVCTPDIYAFNEERRLVYHGRLDDNWKEPSQVTEQSLKISLECMLSGKAIPENQIPPMGCSIKWK